MQSNKIERTASEMLTRRSDFVCVQKAGQKWVAKTVILQIKANDLDRIRLGFTITKKIFKSAVKRNRVKRRLRSAAADIILMHAKPGYDYILIGRDETLTCDYQRLVSDLKWCLKKKDLLKR